MSASAASAAAVGTTPPTRPKIAKKKKNCRSARSLQSREEIKARVCPENAARPGRAVQPVVTGHTLNVREPGAAAMLPQPT